MNATSRIPILVSALVCPGAGQFLQRRWFAGSFFMITFLSAFIGVMIAAFRILSAYYALAFNPETEASANIGLRYIIAPLIWAVIFYIMNLFDMTAQYRRAAHEQREEAFLKMHLPIITEQQPTSPQPPEPPTDDSAA